VKRMNVPAYCSAAPSILNTNITSSFFGPAHFNVSDKVIARLSRIGLAILQNVREDTMRFNVGEGILVCKAALVGFIFLGIPNLLKVFIRISANFLTLLV
jgi:hypothetical protein